MKSDLFHSTMTREDLAQYYIETHQFVLGTEPTDLQGLGRAALANRIETLAEQYKQVQHSK